MTDKPRKKSRFASDHLMIDILMSAMFFFTIASVVVFFTCYGNVVEVSFPYLMTVLVMSVLFTLVRRFKLNFFLMLLAHIGLSAVYIYLIRLLIMPSTPTILYLGVTLFGVFIHSMCQRYRKQTFSVRYDGFVFAMSVQFFVLLFVFYHNFANAVLIATLNTILATSCFFVARQIGTLEDKYYHSIRAVATPTKAIMKQNRLITGLIILGIAFSVFMLYVFPMNEAFALLRAALAFIIAHFFKKIDPETEVMRPISEEFEFHQDTTEINPFLLMLEKAIGVILVLFFLYALIYLVVSVIRSFTNMDIKDKESSKNDAVTDVIENIREETKKEHRNFGSGYEKRIRKKYYNKVKHAMAKGAPVKNSSTTKQIEDLIRNAGDKSITELTEKYEEVRYNR